MRPVLFKPRKQSGMAKVMRFTFQPPFITLPTKAHSVEQIAHIFYPIVKNRSFANDATHSGKLIINVIAIITVVKISTEKRGLKEHKGWNI